MSNITINMDRLLAPVSSDNPVGANMEYDPLFDEIREARESDPDYLPQDEWSTSLRKAEWSSVISLSEEFLVHASKDLQVGCWLAEALVHQHGIPGLLFGIRFLHQFISLYWEQCWPALSDDGLPERQGKLGQLDRLLAKQLHLEPLLGRPESTLEFWQKVLIFEHQVSLQPDSRPTLLEDGDYSMESFNRWVATVPVALLNTTREMLGECREEVQQFERRYQELNPTCENVIFSHTHEKLDEITDFFHRLGERVTQDYSDVMSLNVLMPQDVEPITASETPRQLMSRDLAISQMLTIAHFFRQTEPSSPVPFLMDRAARWAGMALTEWLEEMIEDDNSLRNINNVLKGSNSQ